MPALSPARRDVQRDGLVSDLLAPARWSAPRSAAAGGIFSGAERGQSKANQQANQQLEAVSLKPEEVRKNFTVSGYVFFPKGQYNHVEMLLVDRETGDTQVVSEPWH